MGKGLYVCVLHNIPLAVLQGTMIIKTDACLKASRLRVQQLEDPPVVPVKEQIRLAVAEYRKVYAQLTKEGYPDSIADKCAKEAVNGK